MATRNLVPRATNEGSLGTDLKLWNELNVNKAYASNNVLVFNTVADMKASNKVKAGYTLKTLGYYSPNDGGGAEYIVVDDIGDDEVDDGNIIQLQKNLYAKLMISDYVNIKQFGAYGDGVHDDTEAIQTAIDFAQENYLSLFIPNGNFKITTLNFNGTNSNKPINGQWDSVHHIFGVDRRKSKIISDSNFNYDDKYVITLNNTAGVYIHDFGVYATTNDNVINLADFSWIGGSSEDPDLAPSNLNIMENMWFECGKVNMDKFHDSKINGITIRGEKSELSLICGGGFVAISDLQAYVRKPVSISCQNGSISNAIFLCGLNLAGSSYNNISINSCHFFDENNEGLIQSTASGNATRGTIFNNCYFNNTTKSVITGKYWQGLEFNGCSFSGWGDSFLGEITNGAGSGIKATFTFNYCSFQQALDENTSNPIILKKCRINTGSITNDLVYYNDYPYHISSMKNENNVLFNKYGLEIYNNSTENGTFISTAHSIWTTAIIKENTLTYNEWYTINQNNNINLPSYNGAFLVYLSGKISSPKAIYAIAKSASMALSTANILVQCPSVGSNSGDTFECRFNNTELQIRVVNSSKNDVYQNSISIAIQGLFGVG